MPKVYKVIITRSLLCAATLIQPIATKWTGRNKSNRSVIEELGSKKIN